jgi:hypothetical protein
MNQEVNQKLDISQYLQYVFITIYIKLGCLLMQQHWKLEIDDKYSFLNYFQVSMGFGSGQIQKFWAMG